MIRKQPFDSIVQLETAARERFEEACLLRLARRPFIAIYLFGYAIEMWLKAAYFHNEGICGVSDPLRQADRDRAWRQRQAAGFLRATVNQHDLDAWAHLLVFIRRVKGFHAPYAPTVEGAIRSNAATAYTHWNVEMRYQHISPVLASEVDEMLENAAWFSAHYSSL